MRKERKQHMYSTKKMWTREGEQVDRQRWLHSAWLDVKSMNFVALHVTLKRMEIETEAFHTLIWKLFSFLFHLIDNFSLKSSKWTHKSSYFLCLYFDIGINWFAITEIEWPERYYRHRKLYMNRVDSVYFLLFRAHKSPPPKYISWNV